jgi:putative aldouronate transport system substrate-binding protein
MKRKTRIVQKLSFAAALLLLLAMPEGCHGSPVSSEANNRSQQKVTASRENAAAVIYPIKTDVVLSYWLQSPTTLKSTINDVPFYQEWQKQTGVSVKFSEVSSAQAAEAFSVLLSSGDLPDIVEYNWLKFPGGPAKALEEGYILKLNDLIENHAPNLKKYLREHPDVDKLIKTDEGDYYGFPFLQPEGGRTTQWFGPVIRKDWLDELGLEVPATISEWHDVLTAFKQKKGAEIPLTFVGQPNSLQGFLNGDFIGAYGVIRDFHLDGSGKVQYGPLQPGYRDFLKTMNKWYKEGLLDPNFSQNDRKTLDANIISGRSGATAWSAANTDKWELALAEKRPNAGFIYAPYPVLKKGDTPRFGQDSWAFSGASAAISAKSKNPELAVQVLDYAYSEAGYLLFNYGIEGESYTLVDGKPVLTNLIKNNPGNLSYVEALALYAHSVNDGPYIQSKDLFDQVSVINENHNFETWKTDNLKNVLPPLTVSAEESGEFSQIITDVDTLVDELTIKIILGTEPIEAYDRLAETLKGLNIGRAVEIQQAAYERFQNR